MSPVYTRPAFFVAVGGCFLKKKDSIKTLVTFIFFIFFYFLLSTSPDYKHYHRLRVVMNVFYFVIKHVSFSDKYGTPVELRPSLARSRLSQ